MTGFGQGSASGERHQVSVTLRSVNGRFLDLVVRLDEPYRALEAPLRARLEEQLRRGRVEINVDVRPLQALPARVTIQTGVVEALHRAWHDLAERGLVASELTLGDLLRIPEVVSVQLAADQVGEEEQSLALAAAHTALLQLVEAREQEGEQLARILGERLAELTQAAARLRARAPAVRDELHASLARRLQELLASRPGQDNRAVDDVRLAQEVALLVERGDVTEELDRLDAHLAHFAELLSGDGSLGKRLDFLSQEILRELNTVGSKCRDAEMARTVLDAKVLCEQLREQVQNVE
ncbi:MAG TPA: YicC/YloC family endoribonuclease [Thermoanaerobaculia bacterium]|nr:YicC/YloC family endoribonuclease [Thermoanaerobaculia bacterium]